MKLHIPTLISRTSVLTLAALSLTFPLRSFADAPAAADVPIVKVPVMPKSFNQGILFPYSYLDAALNGKVDSKGGVDYATLRGDANLNIFIQAVATADMERFPVFPVKDEKTGEIRQSHNAELVFWINAYNAHVIKTVSDAYPIDKISDLKNFDTAKTHVVAGKNYSFAEMRKKILAFDTRALFALTDGSRGGPLMLPQAYRFRTINNDLNDAVTRFVDDPKNLEISRIQSKVTLSDFFKNAADALNAKGSNEKKMDGLRNLLTTYSTARGASSFLGANPYYIDFKAADKTINTQQN